MIVKIKGGTLEAKILDALQRLSSKPAIEIQKNWRKLQRAVRKRNKTLAKSSKRNSVQYGLR